MAKIDINKRIHKSNYSMSDLHSHSHYEIYYLIKGDRLFFLENKLCEICEPTLIIIPPHIMHKTEGGPFIRYNILVNPKYLNKFQVETLEKLKLIAIKPNQNQKSYFEDLLKKANSITSKKYKDDILDALFSYFIYCLSEIEISTASPSEYNKPIPPIILKIINFMHNHYTEDITLEMLSKKFFISKNTLNYNFKRHTSSTPIEYLLSIRISKAQELLVTTSKSINQISQECGFTSPNYFGQIFKKHLHISPSTYRKTDR